MMKKHLLLAVLAMSSHFSFVQANEIAAYEKATRITNEERARYTIGVFKAEIEQLDEKIKIQLEKSISKSLKENGFKIINLNIASTTKRDMAKVTVKVTKPVKSKNASYNEIQEYLAAVQGICVNASTINGKCHLEAMSTFTVVNPKNSFSYVKTLLK